MTNAPLAERQSCLPPLPPSPGRRRTTDIPARRIQRQRWEAFNALFKVRRGANSVTMKCRLLSCGAGPDGPASASFSKSHLILTSRGRMKKKKTSARPTQGNLNLISCDFLLPGSASQLPGGFDNDVDVFENCVLLNMISSSLQGRANKCKTDGEFLNNCSHILKRHVFCKSRCFSCVAAAGGYFHVITFFFFLLSAVDNFLLNCILLAAVPVIDWVPFF